MEDLFLHPHSEIPDEIWSAASPRERQLAAIQFWADTTKVAASSPVKEKIRHALLKENGPELIAGGITGLLGVGYSGYQSKKTKSGLSREQAGLAADAARLREVERQEGKPSKLSRAVLDLKKRIAKMRADNPYVAAGLSGIGAGLLSAVLTRRALKKATNAAN